MLVPARLSSYIECAYSHVGIVSHFPGQGGLVRWPVCSETRRARDWYSGAGALSIVLESRHAQESNWSYPRELEVHCARDSRMVDPQRSPPLICRCSHGSNFPLALRYNTYGPNYQLGVGPPLKPGSEPLHSLVGEQTIYNHIGLWLLFEPNPEYHSVD